MKLARKVPHPIPYQGSKRRLAARILAEMPTAFQRLVEPFAGSAAISLAVAQQGRTHSFWINDAHAPLIALWQAILESPDELSLNYRTLWHAQQGCERDFFNEVRSQFNASRQPEHFLYLLARCVKAAVRYNSQGEFNNTPDHRRQGAQPDTMHARIQGAAELLAGKTTITSRDYRDVLAECGHQDVIYMDPPYQGVGGVRDGRYGSKIQHTEFLESLEELNRRNCRYLVSYDGRTGEKVYGEPLPKSLRLTHLELHAGRSSQATLLGNISVTYESLYLSPTLERFRK